MGKAADLGVAGIDEMRNPGTLACPADTLDIFGRRAALNLGAVFVLLGVLGEMSVGPEIVFVGEAR